MIVDEMGIIWENAQDVPDYGSLYFIKCDCNNVNEYGGESEDDVQKLTLITNAAYGSTCLFSNGSIYRLGKSGWIKFGGTDE